MKPPYCVGNISEDDMTKKRIGLLTHPSTEPQIHDKNGRGGEGTHGLTAQNKCKKDSEEELRNRSVCYCPFWRGSEIS